MPTCRERPELAVRSGCLLDPVLYPTPGMPLASCILLLWPCRVWERAGCSLGDASSPPVPRLASLGHVFFFSCGALATRPVQPGPRASPESAVASPPADRTPHGILALGPLCSSACQEPPSAHSLALPLDSGALSKPILPSHPGGRSALLWLCFWSWLLVTC